MARTRSLLAGLAVICLADLMQGASGQNATNATTTTTTTATTTTTTWAAASSTTTTTRIETTTATTNVASTANKTVVITGALTMTVADPATFASDPKAAAGIANGLSVLLGVNAAYIQVVIRVAVRRLHGGEGLRRLAGSVTVSYTITIPPDAQAGVPSAASLVSQISAAQTNMTALQSAIATELAKVSAYTVQVTAVAAPTQSLVDVVTTTTTTTATGRSSGSARIGAAPAARGAIVLGSGWVPGVGRGAALQEDCTRLGPIN